MVEGSKELATLSRFDVAASDIFIVSSTVLTAEFKRCLIDPLSTSSLQKRSISAPHTQSKRAKSDKGSACSGVDAEASFWAAYISKQERGESSRKRKGRWELKTLNATQREASVLSTMGHAAAHSLSLSLSSAGSFDRAKSPVLGVHFARLAVDEGHRLINCSSMHVQLAGLIRADKR